MTTRLPEIPRSVYVLTGALGAAAIALAIATGWHDLTVDVWVLAPLMATLVAAGMIQLDIHYRAEKNALDLFEAAILPVILVFPGPGAILLTAATKLISQWLVGVRGVKVAFNVAQWSLAAAAASAVFLQVRHSPIGDMGALALAMVCAVAVNHFAVAGVMSLVQRRPYVAVVRAMSTAVAHGLVLTDTINVSFGLLFATVIAARPELSVLFLPPLAMLGWAHRTYTALEVDRARIEALQRATHHLSRDATPVEVLPEVLEAIRSAFEAAAVSVVLHDDAVQATAGDQSLAPLARTLAGASNPVPSLRVRATDGTDVAVHLDEAGHRCALLATLTVQGRAFGTLVSIDRGGADGFADGELAVFEALAAEIASALVRGDLHATLERERSRLFEIVHRSSDGIFTVTRDGTVVEWNPAMAAMTGFPTPGDGGGHVTALLRARTADGDDVTLEAWHETGTDALPTEISIVTRAGETRILACSFSETASEPKSLVVVARDVTRQRELDRLRDDFVATVSHELRTPLTSIVGFTTILSEQSQSISEGDREQAVLLIRKGARRLQRLIYNLLEVSRIERRPASELAAVDIDEACATAVHELRELHPGREVRVHAGAGTVRAIGNQMSVEQIVTNLIGNALKYSEGGPIEVHVTEAPESLTISVSDSGPGIPTSEQERIFDRFHRVDQHHVQAGTGLGLYISRQLATAMNGTLTVKSKSGEGSTFSLTLPAELHLLAVS